MLICSAIKLFTWHVAKNSVHCSFILKAICYSLSTSLASIFSQVKRKRKAAHQVRGGLDAGLVLWSGRVQRHQVEPGRHLKACSGNISVSHQEYS